MPDSTKTKLALSVDEAIEALSIGRTALFELLARGEIISVKVGRRRIIPKASLEQYLARLIREQAGENRPPSEAITPWPA